MNDEEIGQKESSPADGVSGHEARTEAILRTTLEELAAVGYGALSFETIAARVGVAKTTVYRRYPTKAVLVRAAVERYIFKAIGDPPSTGSLRSDLIAIGLQLVQTASSAVGRSLMRVALLHHAEPDLAEMSRIFEVQRQQLLNPIAQRSVERGELPSPAVFREIVDCMTGTIVLKHLLRHQAVTEVEIAAIVDLLLNGARQAKPRT